MKDSEKLKKLRETFNVTQSELAAYLGYFTKGIPNKSVISQWESDKRPMNMRIWMLIDNFFEEKNNERRTK